MRVLIVGAGPTGLTAALEFTRQGIIPEIVDAKDKPSELSRAVGILPNSIQKLEASGASEGILKESVPMRNIKIHRNNKVLVDFDITNFLELKNAPIFLPQDRIEAIMSDSLEKLGAKVEYGVKVTDIKTDPKEAIVTFENGESKKYDWVIGSDGVNSTVREKLGIEYLGYELPETWSIADIELESGQNLESGFTAWIIEEKEKNIAVMVPIGPQRVRLISSTPNCIEALPVKLNIKKIRREGAFKIPIRQAETYIKGRILLAGDSAHAHSPVGGKGMNLGIDDAFEAVKAILENKTNEYNDSRRKIGRRIINLTERVRKALMSNNIFTKIFLGLIFFLLRHFRSLRKITVRNIARL